MGAKTKKLIARRRNFSKHPAVRPQVLFRAAGDPALCLPYPSAAIYVDLAQIADDASPHAIEVGTPCLPCGPTLSSRDRAVLT